MKISPSIVRIKKIESPTIPMEFDEIQLEKAAQLVLKMEGTITPIILRRTEPEKEAYTIIDGYFEYYAALKAMEIDSRKGKTINAYIIESEDETSMYVQQIEVFRQRQSAQPQTSMLSKSEFIEVTSSQEMADNSFVAIEKTLNQLVAKNDALEKTMTEMRVRGNVLYDAVEAIKQVGDQVGNIGAQIKQELGDQIRNVISDQMKILKTSLEISRSPVTMTPSEPSVQTIEPVILEESPKPPEDTIAQPPVIPIMEQKFLKELNEPPPSKFTLKLGRALETVGIKQQQNKEKVISRIDNERQKWPFTSIDELAKRIKGSGLGPKKIEKMVNQWY
jgi:hypothetical protein